MPPNADCADRIVARARAISRGSYTGAGMAVEMRLRVLALDFKMPPDDRGFPSFDALSSTLLDWVCPTVDR